MTYVVHINVKDKIAWEYAATRIWICPDKERGMELAMIMMPFLNDYHREP